jgi:hypothetical protein
MSQESHHNSDIEMTTVSAQNSSSSEILDSLTPTITTPRGDFTPDEIPEHLQDDCLVKYFRCRYTERKQLLSSLEDESDKKRVQREIERIKNLRVSFFASKENRRVVREYLRLRANWKNDAQKESQDRLSNIGQRVEGMTKIKPGDRIQRENMERDILEQVKHWKWTAPPPPKKKKSKPQQPEASQQPDIMHRLFAKFRKPMPDPNVDDNTEESDTDSDETEQTESQQRALPADSYGISVNQITLKKSSKDDSSSFTGYDIVRHPLNEVLYGTENNPLRRIVDKAEPNEIRYFHFPSNNMYWIEVWFPKYHLALRSLADFTLGGDCAVLWRGVFWRV